MYIYKKKNAIFYPILPCGQVKHKSHLPRLEIQLPWESRQILMSSPGCIKQRSHLPGTCVLTGYAGCVKILMAEA